jgi:CHAT domain-containing protein/tetratricopeptide (TPR) repeat protein
MQGPLFRLKSMLQRWMGITSLGYGIYLTQGSLTALRASLLPGDVAPSLESRIDPAQGTKQGGGAALRESALWAQAEDLQGRGIEAVQAEAYEGAMDHLTQAAGVWDQIDGKRLLAAAHRSLAGRCARRLGQHERADGLIDQALAVFITAGDWDAAVTETLAEVRELAQTHAGRSVRAHHLLERARGWMVDHPALAPRGVDWWYTVALLAHTAGDYARATEGVDTALSLLEPGESSPVALAVQQLGELIKRRQGMIRNELSIKPEPESAAGGPPAEPSLSIGELPTVLSRPAQAIAWLDRGTALHRMGRVSEAILSFQLGESLAIRCLPLADATRRHLAENLWCTWLDDDRPGPPPSVAAAQAARRAYDGALAAVHESLTGSPAACLAYRRQFDLASLLCAADFSVEDWATQLLSTHGLVLRQRQARLAERGRLSRAVQATAWAAEARAVALALDHAPLEDRWLAESALWPSLGDPPLVALPQVEWSAVREALPPRSALVVYTLHRRWRGATARDAARFDPRYAALVLVPDRPPARVPLTLSSADEAWDAPEASLGVLGTRLWEPIEALWPPETETVFVCLDGGLSRLPLACFQRKDGTTLLERGPTVIYLQHPASLLGSAAADAPLGEVSCLGMALPRLAPGRGGDHLPQLGEGALRAALPSVREEMAALTATAPQRWAWLSEDEATESAFRHHLATQPPTVLHFAGHAANPLTGRASARTAQEDEAWAHPDLWALNRTDVPALQPLFPFYHALQPAASESPSDDSLLAQELAALDLSGTALVTFSTCSAGLGLVTGGEASLDFAAAAHWAGARDVLVASRPLADRQACVFMSDFHQRLARGQGPAHAAWQAQRQLWLSLRATQPLAEAVRSVGYFRLIRCR